MKTPSAAFVRSLPKVELHAHLSGSISRQTLHRAWSTSRLRSELADPLDAIRPGADFVDVVSFFPLFDKYIYALLQDEASISFATAQVIDDFANDGVVYLELRTTPRAVQGLSKARYVECVNRTIATHSPSQPIQVRLILCIDRKMTSSEAVEVVLLALQHRHDQGKGVVVGIDLCGNPAKGSVNDYTVAFRMAEQYGLKRTVHFAEVPASASAEELDTILSWNPHRLGHVIHVPDSYKHIIEDRKVALELCLSCNVLSKLTTGGFAAHHFREWRHSACPIALSTDDVGIFASPLSNEYLLAAQHFDLTCNDLITLSKRAAAAAFSSQDQILERISQFETQWQNGLTF